MVLGHSPNQPEPFTCLSSSASLLSSHTALPVVPLTELCLPQDLCSAFSALPASLAL